MYIMGHRTICDRVCRIWCTMAISIYYIHVRREKLRWLQWSTVTLMITSPCSRYAPSSVVKKYVSIHTGKHRTRGRFVYRTCIRCELHCHWQSTMHGWNFWHLYYIYLDNLSMTMPSCFVAGVSILMATTMACCLQINSTVQPWHYSGSCMYIGVRAQQATLWYFNGGSTRALLDIFRYTSASTDVMCVDAIVMYPINW
jgi:hypothetical protein